MNYPEDEIFQKHRLIQGAPERFGFVKDHDVYVLNTSLKGGFDLRIEIKADGSVYGKAYDPDTNDEYSLLHTRDPEGEFVKSVQYEYRALLSKIADTCYQTLEFASDQANSIALFLKENFSESPDNPFSDLPSARVFRIAKNRKWYALVMQVKAGKLTGVKDQDEDHKHSADDLVEIVNLKADPEEIPDLCKHRGIIPAYHMNKKLWISVILDGSVEDSLLLSLVKKSRLLVSSPKKRSK